MSFTPIFAKEYPNLATLPNQIDGGLILVPTRFTFSNNPATAKYKAHLYICNGCQTIMPWCQEAIKRRKPCPTCGARRLVETRFFFLYQAPEELKLHVVLASTLPEASEIYANLPEILPDPLVVFREQPPMHAKSLRDYEHPLLRRYKGHWVPSASPAKLTAPPVIALDPSTPKEQVSYAKPKKAKRSTGIPIQDLMRLSK